MASTIESTNTIKIFLVFAREDIALRDELEKHLSALKRQGQISSWYNREIPADSEQDNEIDVHLSTAQIILLLVSPDFMHSDYCYGIEMKRVIEEHEAGKAYVIPIILRPVDWEDAPFSKLPVLPIEGKAITSWPNRDEAFFNIARGIRNTVKGLLASYKVAEGDTLYKDRRYDEALAAYNQAILLDPDDASAYNGKGNVLYDLRRYAEALSTYDQAILFNPGFALAYNGKGNVLYDLQRYDEALTAYEQAIYLAPDNPLVHYNKGTTLYHLRYYEKALATFEYTILLDPSFALAYNGKGNVLYDLRRYDEALSAFEQAILFDPYYAYAWYNKGNTLSQLKRYDEALSSFEQAIFFDPDIALAYNGKGNVLYDLQRYDEALSAYEQTILLDPSLALAYNGKGNVLFDMGLYTEALSAYEQATLLDSDCAPAYNGKGNVLYDLQRYDEALSAYKQVTHLTPNNHLVFYKKGITLYHLRRYEEALIDLDQAILLSPKHPSAYIGKGNALRYLRRYDEALSAYEQALLLDPYSGLAYSGKGNVLYDLRRYDEALSAYEQAIYFFPNNDLIYINKGNTLRYLRRYDEALSAYEQALALNPASSSAYIGKGSVLFDQKRYKLALAAFEQALALNPTSSAYIGKGNVLFDQKRYKLALAAFEQALALNSASSSAYIGKGNALHNLRRYKAALEAFEQAIHLAPNLASAYNGKANALYHLKRYKEAVRTYDQAIFLDPKDASAYNGKGNALYHLKWFSEAVDVYDQAILLGLRSSSAYNGKGNALRNLRRYEAALESYEYAIRAAPNDASLYYNKGNSLYDLKRYEEALAAFKQALLLAPDDAAAHYSKGMILYDLKRYEEALAAFEQSTLLAPDNAAAHYNKGLTLEKLKRHDEALAAYKQAIGLNHDIEPENSQSLVARIKSVQEFLVKAGFVFSNISAPLALGFLVNARKSAWSERFPNGLYVRILLDRPLDQSTVRDIHLEARAFSDCALVLVNEQPEISGWMAMGGLRLEDKERFVLIPIAESLIKESSALKERHTLSIQVNKYLGKDFDPYDVRSPVSDAVSFFGRESVTDEIMSALKLGQSLGLFGLHKMGKSSVLQRLQKKAEFPAAYVYLSKGDSLDGIYKRILEGWSRDIHIKYPGLKWSPPQINADPKMFFDSSAKDLLRLLESVTNTPLLAIFLDEIEHIVPFQERDEAILQLYIGLMDSLRGLQQETNNLSLLIAGIHPHIARRNYLWHNHKNPLHQVILERFLLPLDKEDCAYMIRCLGQQINLTYHDQAVEYIVQMSGAHPFLARQICSLAYKNRGDNDIISLQTIQKAAHDFVNNPATASYFDDYGLWGELGKPDIWGEDISYANHKILCTLANSETCLAESSIYSDLHAKIAERSLIALRERGIISATSEHPGHYYITLGLFRDWIRLHKLGVE